MLDVKLKIKVSNIREINFDRTFNNLKKWMKKDLQSGIELKKTTENQRVRKNAPSTIANKGFDHWMVETGAFVKKGFKVFSDAHNAWLKVSTRKHPSAKRGGVRYKDLVSFHNKKHRGEFFWITKRLKRFIQKNNKFKRWMSFDIKRSIKEAGL